MRSCSVSHICDTFKRAIIRVRTAQYEYFGDNKALDDPHSTMRFNDGVFDVVAIFLSLALSVSCTDTGT